MVADPVGDMLIRIKNASEAKKASALIPYSNFRFAIAELLKNEGYIASYEKKGKKLPRFIEIGILYEGGNPRITDVKRISKLSRRVYAGVSEIKPVRQGYGIRVLSTPKGILTDKQARKEHVGGEVLFAIW